MAVLAATKQPGARVPSQAGQVLAKKLTKTKILLRSVSKHKPYSGQTRAIQAAAWGRVHEEVWRGDVAAFDVRTKFTMLMAIPDKDQRMFSGWDTSMYQLRTQLAQEYAEATRTTEALDEDDTVSLAELEETQVDVHSETDGEERVHEDTAVSRGLPPASAADANSKRRRTVPPTSSDQTYDDDPHDEHEKVGRDDEDVEEDGQDAVSAAEATQAAQVEVPCGSDRIDADRLIRVVVALKPHNQKPDHESWTRVVQTLQKEGAARKVTTRGLKVRFGKVLRTFEGGRGGDDTSELRVMLRDYCESVMYPTPAMNRFIGSMGSTATRMQTDRAIQSLAYTHSEHHDNGQDDGNAVPVKTHQRERPRTSSRSARRVAAQTTAPTALPVPAFDPSAVSAFMEWDRRIHEEMMALATYRSRCENAEAVRAFLGGNA